MLHTHTGTCRDQYDWLPHTDLVHEVEMEKVPFLQPVIDFVNFAGELVSTKVKYLWMCLLFFYSCVVLCLDWHIDGRILTLFFLLVIVFLLLYAHRTTLSFSTTWAPTYVILLAFAPVCCTSPSSAIRRSRYKLELTRCIFVTIASQYVLYKSCNFLYAICIHAGFETGVACFGGQVRYNISA